MPKFRRKKKCNFFEVLKLLTIEIYKNITVPESNSHPPMQWIPSLLRSMISWCRMFGPLLWFRSVRIKILLRLTFLQELISDACENKKLSKITSRSAQAWNQDDWEDARAHDFDVHTQTRDIHTTFFDYPRIPSRHDALNREPAFQNRKNSKTAIRTKIKSFCFCKSKLKSLRTQKQILP